MALAYVIRSVIYHDCVDEATEIWKAEGVRLHWISNSNPGSALQRMAVAIVDQEMTMTRLGTDDPDVATIYVIQSCNYNACLRCAIGKPAPSSWLPETYTHSIRISLVVGRGFHLGYPTTPSGDRE